MADTQPNADGALERILQDIQGAPIGPSSLLHTPTGTISLFRLVKAATG